MKGIDISNNNGFVNFTKVKNTNYELIYIKATEGTTFVDPYLETFYSRANALDFKIGFYHFLVSTSRPETQAINFYNQIKNKKNSLKPCLDIETTGYDIMDYTNRFISKFESLCSLPLCIYTSPYYANANLDSSLNRYSCWIANYGTNTPMETNIWGSNYAGHQYTEKGQVSGVNGYVDLNNFETSIFVNKNSVDNNNDTIIEDSWIKRLQNECNNQGFSNQIVDGIKGPITLASCPTVRIGARGEITRLIQEKLSIVEDGIFGVNTESAVINYQKNNGLVPDGIVGKKTWSKLLGLS